MDEMQLMDVQQKKLTKWLMEANAEVAQLRKSEEAARGGKAKFANDPRAKAKKDALELWPEANGKGWTAAQFHTALTKKGHVLAYDAARQWMTSLRQTGVCSQAPACTSRRSSKAFATANIAAIPHVTRVYAGSWQ